jgi:hypothetical protein
MLERRVRAGAASGHKTDLQSDTPNWRTEILPTAGSWLKKTDELPMSFPTR